MITITIKLEKPEAMELRSFISHHYDQMEDIAMSIETTLAQLDEQLK